MFHCVCTGRYLHALRLCGVHRELVARSASGGVRMDDDDGSGGGDASPDNLHNGKYNFDFSDLQNLPTLLRPPVEASVVSTVPVEY